MSFVEKIAAWLLAILWIAPLLYAGWAAFHPAAYATHFDLAAPLTLQEPSSPSDAIKQKFGIAAALKAEYATEDWALTETAWQEFDPKIALDQTTGNVAVAGSR